MGKHEAQLHETIQAKPSSVWKALSDASEFATWFPHATSAELKGAKKPAVGVRRRVVVDHDGTKIESEQELTEFEPERRFGWRHLEDTVDGKPFTMIEESEMHFGMEPVGSETKVTLVVQWELGGLKAKLLAPKIRSVVTSIASEALANLKKHVEA